MRNFQNTFETRKRSFINVFSICMTVPLSIIRLQKVIVFPRKKKSFESTSNFA